MTTVNSTEARLQRVHEAAECHTQKELATFLEIGQSSISDAKRRGSVPSDWLITLFVKKRINPEWILTGQGPRHAIPTENILPHTVFAPPAQCSLTELLREVVRRIL